MQFSNKTDISKQFRFAVHENIITQRQSRKFVDMRIRERKKIEIDITGCDETLLSESHIAQLYFQYLIFSIFFSYDINKSIDI